MQHHQSYVLDLQESPLLQFSVHRSGRPARIWISDVQGGTEAEQGGAAHGHYIVSVNGAITAGMTLLQARIALLGDPPVRVEFSTSVS